MKSFPVDDEVIAAVWQKANPKPFENLTFNAALRQILGLTDGTGGMSERISGGSAPSKAPKADLRLLVSAGLLRDGEPLHLIDYRGNRVKQCTALITNGRLVFEGKRYSMSLLARDLLRKLGFQSEFVRGPAHWVNADGKSIKELWEQYSEARASTEAAYRAGDGVRSHRRPTQSV